MSTIVGKNLPKGTVALQRQAGLIAFLVLSGALIGALLLGAIAFERQNRSEDSSLASAALLFLPFEPSIVEGGRADAQLASLEQALTSSGLIQQLRRIPRAEQVSAIAALIGDRQGAPRSLEELPLADVFSLQLEGLNGKRDQILSLARETFPDRAVTLIDFSSERGARAQAVLPLRVFVLFVLAGLAAMLSIATLMAVRLLVLKQQQVWRTLLLVGVGPSVILNAFSSAVFRVVVPALLIGALVGAGLLLVFTLVFSGSSLVSVRDVFATPLLAVIWLGLVLGVALILSGCAALLVRRTVFSQLD